MSRHDRTLAAVSAIALIAMIGLALSPRWVLYPAIGVAFLLWIAGLIWMVLTADPAGGACDRIDEELTANERRHLRQIKHEREHPPRLMLVREQGADVIRFLPPSHDRDSAS
jgi:hypothetical protein